GLIGVLSNAGTTTAMEAMGIKNGFPMVALFCATRDWPAFGTAAIAGAASEAELAVLGRAPPGATTIGAALSSILPAAVDTGKATWISPVFTARFRVPGLVAAEESTVLPEFTVPLMNGNASPAAPGWDWPVATNEIAGIGWPFEKSTMRLP